MRIVVLGASGLTGKIVTQKLQQAGHQVITASRSSGVNLTTGQGLANALARAQGIVDLTNSPPADGQAALSFFSTSAQKIVAEAKRLDSPPHIVILSVVGADRLTEMVYFQAKVLQEEIYANSGLGYTIIRATQYYQFIPSIALAEPRDHPDGNGKQYYLPPRKFQPLLLEDLADEIVRVVEGKSRNGTIEIAGPEAVSIYETAKLYSETFGKDWPLVQDESARYCGLVQLRGDDLLPGPEAIATPTTLAQWMASEAATMS